MHLKEENRQWDPTRRTPHLHCLPPLPPTGRRTSEQLPAGSHGPQGGVEEGLGSWESRRGLSGNREDGHGWSTDRGCTHVDLPDLTNALGYLRC